MHLSTWLACTVILPNPDQHCALRYKFGTIIHRRRKDRNRMMYSVKYASHASASYTGVMLHSHACFLIRLTEVADGFFLPLAVQNNCKLCLYFRGILRDSFHPAAICKLGFYLFTTGFPTSPFPSSCLVIWIRSSFRAMTCVVMRYRGLACAFMLSCTCGSSIAVILRPVFAPHAAYFNSFLISITLFVCIICDVLIM